METRTMPNANLIEAKIKTCLAMPGARVQYRDQTLGNGQKRLVAEIVINPDRPEDKPFAVSTLAIGPNRENVADLSSDFAKLKRTVQNILESIA
jgi:hypothetical protein